MSFLSVENLFLERGDHIIAGPLSFQLQGGGCCLITGPNGSGKTTLLHYLADILPSHHIKKDQECIFLPSAHALFEDWTAEENLNFFEKLLSPSDERTTLREETVHTFSLEDILKKPVHSLSNGQKRRISLSRLLWARNRLWLLDEPELGLDQASQIVLIDLIKSQLKAGGIVVIASHNPLYGHSLTQTNLTKVDLPSGIQNDILKKVA